MFYVRGTSTIANKCIGLSLTGTKRLLELTFAKDVICIFILERYFISNLFLLY